MNPVIETVSYRYTCRHNACIPNNTNQQNFSFQFTVTDTVVLAVNEGEDPVPLIVKVYVPAVVPGFEFELVPDAFVGKSQKPLQALNPVRATNRIMANNIERQRRQRSGAPKKIKSAR